jgi:hypothetical protein
MSEPTKAYAWFLLIGAFVGLLVGNGCGRAAIEPTRLSCAETLAAADESLNDARSEANQALSFLQASRVDVQSASLAVRRTIGEIERIQSDVHAGRNDCPRSLSVTR